MGSHPDSKYWVAVQTPDEGYIVVHRDLDRGWFQQAKSIVSYTDRAGLTVNNGARIVVTNLDIGVFAIDGYSVHGIGRLHRPPCDKLRQHGSGVSLRRSLTERAGTVPVLRGSRHRSRCRRAVPYQKTLAATSGDKPKLPQWAPAVTSQTVLVRHPCRCITFVPSLMESNCSPEIVRRGMFASAHPVTTVRSAFCISSPEGPRCLTL